MNLKDIAYRFNSYAKQCGIEGDISLEIKFSSVDDLQRFQLATTNEFKDCIYQVPGWLKSEFHEFILYGIKWKATLAILDSLEIPHD